MKIILIFILILFLGCSTTPRVCNLSDQKEYRAFEISSELEKELIDKTRDNDTGFMSRNSDRITWYMKSDNLIAACVPGNTRGKWAGCGKIVINYSQSNGVWRYIDEEITMCH